MLSDKVLSYGEVWVGYKRHDSLMINLEKLARPVQIIICCPVSSEIRISFPLRMEEALITEGPLNLLQEKGRTPLLAFTTCCSGEGQVKVRMWPYCFCHFLKCQLVNFLRGGGGGPSVVLTHQCLVLHSQLSMYHKMQ